MADRARFVSAIVALAVPAALLVPLAASGQPKPKPSDKTEKTEKADKADKTDRYDPENITAISQSMELIAKANERFVAKDFTTAIDGYKKAIELSPKSPFGHYMLAQAFLATKNGPEAEAAIAQAQELVPGDAKNALLKSKILFLAADVFERQRKLDQAKVAWQAYIEHAAKLGPDGGAFPQTGAERLKAIQRVLDQEKAYAAVRERIQAERDAARAAASAPKK